MTSVTDTPPNSLSLWEMLPGALGVQLSLIRQTERVMLGGPNSKDNPIKQICILFPIPYLKHLKGEDQAF